MSTPRQGGAFGDELANFGIIALIAAAVIAVLLRVAGTVTAGLSPRPVALLQDRQPHRQPDRRRSPASFRRRMRMAAWSPASGWDWKPDRAAPISRLARCSGSP